MDVCYNKSARERVQEVNTENSMFITFSEGIKIVDKQASMSPR